VLKLAKPEEIYAEVEGRLVELNVRDGDWVKKDTVLAKLSNPEKQIKLIQHQHDYDVSYHNFLWYNRAQREDRARAKQNQEFAEKQEPLIRKTVEQIGKLTLVAGRDGQVVGVPHRETIGQFLKPGKPANTERSSQATRPFFCEIGDPHHLEAHLILDQADVNLISPESRAWLKVYGKAETTYQSAVLVIAQRSREEVPTELSNMAGGEVASKPDPKTGSAKPLEAVYEVIIPVDNPNLELQPGLRGYAKIEGGTFWYQKTMGWWLLRWFNKVFKFSDLFGFTCFSG
jgi:putative peptide zinc metalloprotease protein